MEIPMLKVESRNESGKGPAHRLRGKGFVPAVCYGEGQKPIHLSVNPDELMTILRGPRGLNTLIKLDGIGGQTVMVQDFQRDPVERHLLHIDFLQIDTHKSIQREVVLDFTGKAEGVKVGGILQVAKRTILIEALPTELPDKIIVDTSALLIGQSIHITEVQLPKGVKALYDQNYAVCSVVAPTEEKAVEEEVVAEGEVAAEGVVAEGAEPAEGGAEAKTPGKEDAAPAKDKGKEKDKGKGKEK